MEGSPSKGEPNGLTSRVAVLEASLRNFRSEINELKRDDLHEIKDELKGLRREFQQSRQGMTRSEKTALFAVGITFIMAIIAAVALVFQAGAPT